MTAAAQARPIMLAIFGRERVPRQEHVDDWKWTRSWAHRWWLVRAATVSDARELIRLADEGGGAAHPDFGEIIDCGRNAPGITRTEAPSCRRPSAAASKS